MITYKIKNKEVDITLEYGKTVGNLCKVSIYGTADLSHHLIEGLFDIVDRLSKTSNCCHRKEEYKWKEINKDDL